MSKILRNDTGSDISISDTGVTIQPGAGNQYTIPAVDYLLWAESSDAVTEIGAGNIVVNDGSIDLSISEGTDLIKGLFPKKQGITSGDDYTDIGHTGDRLKVDASIIAGDSSIDNFYIRAALGQIAGVSVQGVQGHNPSVGAAGEDLVANGGIYNFPATAAVLDISSSNAADTYGTGTGAWVVYVQGLDANYNEISETVNLNGTITVNTLQSYLRVHRTTVVAAGTSKFNEGAITVQNGSDVVSCVPAEGGISQDAIFTVPAGKVALFSEAFVVSETNGLQIKTITFSPTGVFITPVIVEMGDPVFNFVPRQPLVLVEKTDFKIFADPVSGVKSVSAIINLVLVDV